MYSFSNRKRNSIEIGHVKIKFLNTPESLNDDPYLGTVNVYRMNIALRVTGRERTLVEGFRKPVHSGGLEEHIESISGFGVLDLDLLKLILKVYNQKKLWASVGWFLSRNTERFGISEDYIGEFESHRPSSPQYLSSQQRTGQLHNRWNLIIPESLNERFEGDAT